jgi:serine/threonine-protein kinase HipA
VTYFPNAEAGQLRVFEDSAPDRWGQTVMKRWEALGAKDEGRRPKTLYAWDFL